MPNPTYALECSPECREVVARSQGPQKNRFGMAFAANITHIALWDGLPALVSTTAGAGAGTIFLENHECRYLLAPTPGQYQNGVLSVVK